MPDVSLYLLNGIGNCDWDPYVRARLPRFVSYLREFYPETPILIFGLPRRTSERFGTDDLRSCEVMSRSVSEIAHELMRTDPHIYHTRVLNDFAVDGHSLEYEATVDGDHPTDLGFFQTAQHLYREILRIRETEKALLKAGERRTADDLA